VNPQRIGGQRIAAAALQPNVVEFLDVVMHDGSLEVRLEEVAVRAGWPGAPSGRRT
jgi:voltage-gated potassium channel